MASVYVLSRHLFVDDFSIVKSSHNIFRCSVPSCPFRLRMNESFVNGHQTFEVDLIIFPQHCHVFKDKKRWETKDIVEHELVLIKQGKDVNNVLEKKHAEWQKQAVEEGKKRKEDLLNKKTAVDMASQFPMATGKQVEIASRHAMDRMQSTWHESAKWEKMITDVFKIYLSSRSSKVFQILK